MNGCKIHHVGVTVTNLDNAINFLQKLGFTLDKIVRNEERGLTLAFLKSDNFNIELYKWDEPQKEQDIFHSPGYHHLAFKVDDIDTVAKNLQQLEKEFPVKTVKSLGAKAALIMIPYSILFGFSENHILYFYQELSRAIDFPLIIYQHPRPFNYSPKLLQELTKIECIVGIKDVSWDYETCRADFEAIDTAERKISKLTGNDTILLSVFALDIDGALLGFAALVPEKVNELFIRVKNGDLTNAKQLNKIVEKFANLIFGPPACQNSARIKEGLVMRNILNNSLVRPPLLSLNDIEKNQIRRYLEALGLLH